MEMNGMDARTRAVYIACIIGGGIALPWAAKAFCWAVLKLAGWL